MAAANVQPHRRVAAIVAFAAIALITASPTLAVSIEMVTVGDAGNANDPATGGIYGGVNYEYQIGKYVVTIGQYTEFLNAVAKTDTYSLYNEAMATDLNIAGISQTGTSGAYTYSVIAASGSSPNGGVSAANRPITYVSWCDAARFVNWMANGQPTGAQTNATTEDGAYRLVGVDNGDTAAARNVTNPNTGATPTYFIPTENEWYKAAYFSPVVNSGSGGYFTYATQSNATPGNVPGSGANQANYNNGVYSVTQANGSINPSQNYLTDVGTFANSASFYGTFDQSGNVFQYNDLTGAGGSRVGVRGGTWVNDAFVSSSWFRDLAGPAGEVNYVGFRLASPVVVPEPSTWVMGAVGLACVAWSAMRHRASRRS